MTCTFVGEVAVLYPVDLIESAILHGWIGVGKQPFDAFPNP